VSGSTYDYNGQVLRGPAKKPLKTFDVATADGKLVVSLK
jgi:Rieske Fe-S protein